MGSGEYELVDRTAGGLYYFVKAEGGQKNLYKGVSVAIYPVADQEFPNVIYTESAVGNTLVRLASGNIYAGLVCQNDSKIRSLCVLWPKDSTS